MSENTVNYFKDKRIIITGGTGFIGSHLLEKILEQKPSAVRIVSSGSRTDRITKYLPKIELKVYKNAPEYVRHIINFKPDYVFILGGNSDPRLSITNARLDLEYNLLYNFRLFERLSRKPIHAKFIYASSVAVYGNDEAALNEDTSVTLPKSPYGINKLASEGYIRFFAQNHNLQAFSVRFSATYGPGLKKQVVYDFMRKLLDDPKKLFIRGNGTEVRDLCYVDDQVDGLILLAQKASYEGEIYNLGSGLGISVLNLAAKITTLMHIKPKIVLEKSKHESHHGHTWILDIAKSRSLGHNPETTIDEGLQKTLDWVVRQ